MKNKMIDRILSGILISHTIAFVLYWVSSLSYGENGAFYPMVPGMADRFGNELIAIIVQNVLITAFGVIFGVAGMLYEYEGWSLMKRTIVHFVLLIGTFLIVSLTLIWIPSDLVTVLRVLFLFLAIYIVIWFVTYAKILRDIRKMNRKIEK